MDSTPVKLEAITAGGMSATVEGGWQVASLRYFERTGSFAAAVSEAVGRPLPDPLRVIEARHPASGAIFVLAWRNPTETLLLCESGVAFAALDRHLAGRTDGCMVDQTGGVSVIRFGGARAREFLLRVAAQTAIPRLGHALSGRCAEVHAMTLCIQEGEFFCLVERVYAAHLLGWIRVTAADF